MPTNLVQRKVLDRRGRWVTRWVRPDTPEAPRAPIPAAARPSHAPSSLVQRSSQAANAIYGRGRVPRYGMRNTHALAEWAPALLDGIVAQCEQDEQLREIWDHELVEPSIPLTRDREARTKAIHDLASRLDAFPRVLGMLRAVGDPVHVRGYAARRVRKLVQWAEQVPDFVDGADGVSRGQQDAIYLLGIARHNHVDGGNWSSAELTDLVWPLSQRLADRTEDLVRIVPELMQRGTIDAGVIDQLLGADAAALREGLL